MSYVDLWHYSSQGVILAIVIWHHYQIKKIKEKSKKKEFMKNFTTLSSIQKQRLQTLIQDDLSVLKWINTGCMLKSFHKDKEGYMYLINFKYSRGWLSVTKEYPLGEKKRYKWTYEGELKWR